MPDPSPTDPTKPIAKAASLFDTDELRPIAVPPSPPSATPAAPATPPPSASVGDGYDLEGYSVPDEEEPPRPVELPKPVERARARPSPSPTPTPTPTPTPRAKSGPSPATARAPASDFESGVDDDREPTSRKRSRDGDTSEFEFEYAPVDLIWGRWAEWGPDLIRVGLAALGTLILAFFASGDLLLAMLVLALGGAATALLAYPILITLERPVRITPEQAVGDFYAAASHHIPHYRRMWLLLSTQGRESGGFSTFEAFQGRWKERVGRLRASRGAGKFAPLAFQVEDFRADKSTGKSTSKADYTVHVYLRGKEEDGPIESVRMSHGLVKGPDRMWYLNRGVLEAEPSAKGPRDGRRAGRPAAEG